MTAPDRSMLCMCSTHCHRPMTCHCLSHQHVCPNRGGCPDYTQPQTNLHSILTRLENDMKNVKEAISKFSTASQLLNDNHHQSRSFVEPTLESSDPNSTDVEEDVVANQIQVDHEVDHDVSITTVESLMQEDIPKVSDLN